jgi:hypothetical protein
MTADAQVGQSEIFRGVYPERQSEILRSAQNDSAERLSFTIALGEISAAGLVRLPLAITGSWVHPATGKKVAVSLDDLRQIQSNFAKKPNGEINVDYDHACTIPNFAGGPRPSAGRVLGMGAPEPFMDRKGVERQILWGQYDPTEMARELIAKKEYRYISPVLERERLDKANGEIQGMTMTSIALTNTPVMEEMPEIALSEAEGAERSSALPQILGMDRIRTERLIECSRPAGRGEEAMSLTLKHSNADGNHHHEVWDGSNKVGEIDHGEFCHYAAAHGGQRFSEENAGELFAEFGMAGKTLADVKQILRSAQDDSAARAAEKKGGETRALILKECLSGQGGFNEDALDKLIVDGKVQFADTVPVKRAVRLVTQQFAAGKLSPAQRNAAIAFACADAEGAKAFFSELRPFVPLAPTGASRGADGDPKNDFLAMVKEREKTAKIPYADALSEVTRENPGLYKEYAHAITHEKEPE